jgi:hypothetical protein
MEQLRLATLAVAIIGLLVVFWAAWHHRGRAWYVLPATLYLGHLGLFYLVRVLKFPSFLGIPLTPENINLWSVTIHIQAAITVTYKAVMMITHNIIGINDA